MKVVYRIEAELDYETDPDLPEYHGQTLTDNRVADLIRDLFYNNTDRYMDQIHASVNVRKETG